MPTKETCKVTLEEIQKLVDKYLEPDGIDTFYNAVFTFVQIKLVTPVEPVKPVQPVEPVQPVQPVEPVVLRRRLPVKTANVSELKEPRELNADEYYAVIYVDIDLPEGKVSEYVRIITRSLSRAKECIEGDERSGELMYENARVKMIIRSKFDAEIEDGLAYEDSIFVDGICGVYL